MMNPPRKLSRRNTLPLTILLVSLLAMACSEDAPTGHKPDPLVGRWEGEFTSLMGGQSVSDAFVIVVVAGGEGTGTGYYTYDYQGAQVAEQICITLEATADGIIAINNDGVITNWNERFIYMWRIPETIVEQKDFNEVLNYMLTQLKNPDVFLLKLTDLEKTSKDAYDMIFFNDGRIFEQYSCPLVQDGEKVGRVWSFKDVT